MVHAWPRPGSSMRTGPSSWVDVHCRALPPLVCHSMVVACMSRMCDFSSSVLLDVKRASSISSDSKIE
jgi:hypothetical protein